MAILDLITASNLAGGSLAAGGEAITNASSFAQKNQPSQADIIQQFRWIFDLIQVAANKGNTFIVVALDPRTNLENDITNLINLLDTTGYVVTVDPNNPIQYFITWGVKNVAGTVITPVSKIVSITPTSILATSGVPLSTSFTVVGGVEPYTYTLTGNLPTGLSFNSGTITGTPNVPTGTASVTILVTDNLSQTFSQLVSINTTAPAISGFNTNIFNGEVGTTISIKFIPTGGTAPYTFNIVGIPPSGLSFSSLTAVGSLTLSGVPTVTGSSIAGLTINVTDSLSQTFSLPVSWNISPATVNGFSFATYPSDTAANAAMGAPVEGMAYVDTTLHKLKVYLNGVWVAQT
jgi:hypothetical protein